MLILLAVLLALIPAIAILYPFLRNTVGNEWLDDESSPRADLERRWDASLAGLRTTELEWSLGNLEEADYRWLRRQYMREAAVVMRAMELEADEEKELLSAVEREIQQVRLRSQGSDGASSTASEASPGQTSSQGRAGE